MDVIKLQKKLESTRVIYYLLVTINVLKDRDKANGHMSELFQIRIHYVATQVYVKL